MDAIQRRTITNPDDREAARRIEVYIGELPGGAWTWPGGAAVRVGNIVRNGRLHIRDTAHGGQAIRHIKLRLDGRVVVTFEFGHEGVLLRTF